MTTRKTWISIAIATVASLCLLALAVVGGTAFFIYRHVDAKFTSETTAHDEFQAARARFKGQQPLIEIKREGDEPILHRDLLSGERMPEKPLESLRVLAYDDTSGKLVHVNIPFWLLRIVPTR